MKATVFSPFPSSPTTASPRGLAVHDGSPSCRLCASEGLQKVLDLGPMPLANGLLAEYQLRSAEPKFPLALAFCPRCSLVQITETVAPEILFRDYPYFSSFSETMLAESHRLADRMIFSRGLDRNSSVLEIASNDGYLLQFYQEAGIPVLGIEPAANVAKVAREKRGIRTISQFFSRELGRELAAQGQQADVVHANNVVAHIADLDDFFNGLEKALKAGGVAVIEVPYVREMIEGLEFDTIYHEHVSYFSLTSIDRAMKSHGFEITDVERLAIHGGSLRVFAEHRTNHTRPTAAVRQMLAEEEKCGVTRFAFYEDFANKISQLKAGLVGLLHDLKAQRGRIAAYGASAKGATLLNYFGIGASTLDFVVDRSTAKQGFYTPGTHLPIFAPEKLLEAMPDHVLLLTWNFADEILEQQAEYRRRGGHFIVPIPEPRMV
ncbi:MAG: class I SAM-dependent methyltransferase [Candidatus Acidiferrales bacterium]